MRIYDLIQKDDMNIFGKKALKPLPFNPIYSTKNEISLKYPKAFLVGVLMGATIEFCMIKFGYYQAFIDAERKKL